MARSINVDVRSLKDFGEKLKKAASGDLKKQYNIWLEAIGMEFLDTVQDEIVRLKVVDTRRLLNSFSRGDDDCIFEMDGDKLRLRIGTNVEYASFVNDGHWTARPRLRTFLKGVKFKERRWVEGYHYFDMSIAIFEKIVAASLDKKLQEWLDEL